MNIKVRCNFKSPLVVYCALTLSSLVLLIAVFLFTRGEAMQRFWFYDSADSGMDFFHSMEYVRAREPYRIFQTLYPPLANFFFLIIYIFVPKSVTENWTYNFMDSVYMRRSEFDLRTYQSCFMLYVIFIIVALGFIALVVQSYLKKAKYVELTVICFIFSYGVLYAIERGNVILLATGCSLFFLCYYQSSNKIMRELALISLALAAGLKLYPAFLGLLLLKERKPMVVLRAILYGIASLILPCFAFKEGLEAIPLWLDIIINYDAGNTEAWFGNGIPNAMAEMAHVIDLLAGSDLASVNYKGAGIVIGLFFLIMALLMKKKWESLLAIIFAMLFQSQYDYFYCMTLLPLLAFLCEESKFNKRNIVPFVLMMCMVLPVPLLYVRDQYYPRDTIIHIAMVVYLVWCLAENFIEHKIGKQFMGLRLSRYKE